MILKQDVEVKKLKVLAYLSRLGFEVIIDIDGRKRSVYINETRFSFEEFMAINIDYFYYLYSKKKNK